MTGAWYVLTAGALTIVGQIANGKTPAPRIIIGAFAAGTGLVLLSSAQPTIARQLGALILTTSLLTSGADVARGVISALN